MEISPDSNFKSDTVIVDVEDESVGEKSHPNVEDSGDKVIPADVSLPSQFLLPILDDSSCDEETEVTEWKPEAEIHDTNQEEEMLSVNSEVSSLVNTNDFLELVDTVDMDSSEITKQSETTIESEQIVESDKDPIEQTSVDPTSESPSTEEKELSKSPMEDSTQKNDSGADDHEDISSHDNDMIAYETKESSSSSIEVSSSTNPVTDIEIVNESEPGIEVEVMEPRSLLEIGNRLNFLGIDYCIE